MFYDQVVEATNAILAHVACKPTVALVLGSGLGDLAQELEDAVAIPYTEIPHFARSTVAGHVGRLLSGNLEGVPVIAMQGRFHLYEGYPPQVLTFPIRVMSSIRSTYVDRDECRRWRQSRLSSRRLYVDP